MEKQTNIHIINSQPQFKTPDHWIAATIMAKGEPIWKIEWIGPNKAIFIFANHSRCEAIAEGYYREDVQVIAKRYADSLRTIKDRIFNTRKSM